MTAVVLRCPHCGTTRATPGECEACHEADVRYYCTNHSPGRWLDGPACGQCGARFGDAVRPPAPSPARAPPPPDRRRAAPADAASRRRPPPRTARTVEVPERMDERDGAGWPATGGPTEPGEAPRVPNPWAELLRRAEQARREHAARRRAEPVRRARGPRLGGCLVQLVLMGLLLLFALASGFFVFAGSLFQLFRFF